MIPAFDDFFTYMQQRASGVSHEDLLERTARLAQRDGQEELDALVTSISERITKAEESQQDVPQDTAEEARALLLRLRAQVLTPLSAHSLSLQSALERAQREITRTHTQERELRCALDALRVQLRTTPAQKPLQDTIERLGAHFCAHPHPQESHCPSVGLEALHTKVSEMKSTSPSSTEILSLVAKGKQELEKISAQLEALSHATRP